ncbi:MAG: hypothetical protein ACK559_05250, partial [bacterium]
VVLDVQRRGIGGRGDWHGRAAMVSVSAFPALQRRQWQVGIGPGSSERPRGHRIGRDHQHHLLASFIREPQHLPRSGGLSDQEPTPARLGAERRQQDRAICRPAQPPGGFHALALGL